MVDSLRNFCIARWITSGCYRGQIHGVNGASSALHWIDDPAITSGVSNAVDPDHLDNSNHSHFVCTECDRGNCLEALGMYGLIKTQSQGSAIGLMSKTLLKVECPAFFEQREPVTNAESSATQFVESACFVGCS